MASSLSSHSSGMSKLSLTQKEMDLPPWDQMLKNGAINPGLVTTSYTDDDSIHEEATEEEKYFSDDDLSENEQLKSGKSKLAAEITPILNLRDYQKELAMNALRGDNTIICAPTGSGKTRVATHIILQHFKLLEERIMKAKVAFLAKTVPLAVQQYKAMCKYMPSYEITVITGQSGEPMSLHMLLRCSDIIVMTPQILENHLNKKLLPHLGVFTMIIFDECHHTRKNDPYNVLMTSYLKVKDKIRNAKEMDEIRKIKLPQIVGLTATIGIGKAVTVEDAVTNIMKICANLDVANLSTVQRHIDELRKVVPVPIEVLQRLRERDEDESVVKIQKLMEKLENQLKHLVKELNDNGFHHEILHDLPGNRKSQAYEQWAVKSKKETKEMAIHDPKRETNIPVRLSIIILEYLIAYRIALETFDLVELKDVIEYLEKCFHEYSHGQGTNGETALFTYFQDLKRLILTRHGEANPNLLILEKKLMRYLVKKGKESRGIIFVRTRALAEALCKWLTRCDNTALKELNPCSFTGSNTPEDKGGTSQAHQEAIIQRFKSGEVRLLVATSVAEEGLDIEKCNLVIKYNHVGSEVSTVQTRGRSRAFGGVSVLLAMGNILQKENINRCRVEWMQQAIEKIQAMDPTAFKAAVEAHQKELLQSAYIAELVQRRRRSQYQSVPFKMLCALCRKVGVENTGVRIVSDSCHVSIDRNLLDHIEVVPEKQPKVIEDCLIVGTVLCKGEPEPGSKCKRQLGRVIKHEKIPFVMLDIRSFSFEIGSQMKLAVYKQWKETNFTIDNLNYYDIERYLEDDRVLSNPEPV